MENGHCFIMLQCLEINVDNRYIHSGINILRVHLFFFLLSFSIFSLTGSKVLCPWLCLILNRFMRTFVSYFLFSRIVKTDCQCTTDWVESPHRLSSHCQAPHIHLWGDLTRQIGQWHFSLTSLPMPLRWGQMYENGGFYGCISCDYSLKIQYYIYVWMHF